MGRKGRKGGGVRCDGIKGGRKGMRRQDGEKGGCGATGARRGMDVWRAGGMADS